MSTGFIRKIDPPHSFPFLTNTKAILEKPIPFSQVPAPADLSESIKSSFQTKPFYPKAIPDLSLWLDGDDISTYNYDNLTWNDKGPSKLAFQALDLSYNTIGNRNYFNNWLSYTITNTAFKIRTNFTIFVVARCDTGLFLLGFDPSTSFEVRTISGWLISNNNGQWVDSVIGNEFSIPVVATNDFFIFTIGFTNFQVGPYRVNGTNRYTIIKPGTYGNTNPPITYTGNFIISSYPDSIFKQNMTGEVLIYDRGLSEDETDTIEGYLASKWNLQGKLPNTHPYKNKSPQIL